MTFPVSTKEEQKTALIAEIDRLIYCYNNDKIDCYEFTVQLQQFADYLKLLNTQTN